MAIEKILLMFTVGLFTTSLLCTDKTVDPPPPTELPVIGDWKLSIPPIANVIPETLDVLLNIEADSQFILKLSKRSGAPLYNSSGTWTATGDSILLSSKTCRVLDTVPDPDTLKNLSDSLCGIPIPLKLPANETEWNIETQKLTGMLSGFPVPKEALNLIPFFLPILPMEKVSLLLE